MLTPLIRVATLVALFGGTVSAQVYLNNTNISVALGASMAPEPFANRTTAASLASVIDAPTAASAENHEQSTHVWVSGGPLELDFDLRAEYDLQVLHVWNYFGEGFDVDNIDFTFYDASRTLVGTLLGVAPALGGAGGNPIFAEDIPLSFPSKVQFVNAVLTGSNGEVDFNNIGFTADISCATASWGNYGAGWPGTSGVPTYTASAAPIFGSTIDLQVANGTGVTTCACLIFGDQATATPTNLGGTILSNILSLVPIASLPVAGMNQPVTIINDPAICGLQIYSQMFQADAGASAGVAFSQGLSLTVGGR